MKVDIEQQVRKYANGMIDFIRESGSSFTAANNIKQKLQKNGINVLEEDKTWDLKKNEGYIVCKQNRNVFSFFIGKNFNINDGAILIVAGHLDSPCLKLTPNNHLIRNKIYQLNVECHGGGLWNTWFDRCLGISGQVLLKRENKVVEKIVQINKPLYFLPSLAIHLQNINEYPIKVDYEKHLKPIGATTFVHDLKKNEKVTEKGKGKGKGKENKNENENENENDKRKDTVNENVTEDLTEKSVSPVSEGLKNSPTILHVLSKELNCKEEDILDFELCLFDCDKACLCGVYEEFICGGRFDNLAGTFAIFEAFTEFLNDIKNDTSAHKKHNNLYIFVSYDDEEIGSNTEVGGKSFLTKLFIDRIISSIFKEELKTLTPAEIYGKLIARSMLVSVDMTHSAHPNYPDHVQPLHKVHFHEGIVIKFYSQKNYVTSHYFSELFKTTLDLHEKYNEEKIKTQYFTVKNTMRCGSTIGPMLAVNLLLPGVDIGIPQLAMHSAREIMGTYDLYYLIKGIQAFCTFYQEARSSFCYEDSTS